MIIDLRIYEIRPEKMRQWLTLWETKALPTQREICGGFLGMYITEVGVVNEVVHMWSYTDMGEREKRRAAMLNDPRWKDYLTALEELGAIRRASSRIIRPTAFSPKIGAIETGAA